MRGSRRTQSEGVLAGSFLHISQWKPIRTKTWMLPRYAPQPTGKLPILSDAVHQCSLFMHILDLCCALPSHFCARSGGRKHLICLQIGAGLVVRRIEFRDFSRLGSAAAREADRLVSSQVAAVLRLFKDDTTRHFTAHTYTQIVLHTNV